VTANKHTAKKIDKPWGYELIYADSDLYAGKILFIRKGESLSLQYHEQKDETLYIQDGVIEFVTMDENGGKEGEGHPVTLVLKEGDAIHIPPGMRHRLSALKDTVVLEVSTPFLDDVVRLEDRYGRV
jgi:mannose-6-phosphate isomerase-like protein (cupin superfamily)